MSFRKTIPIASTLALLTSGSAATIDHVTETGSARYLSGGIGTDERAELERMAGNFDVKVQLAAQSGAYLAGVDVKVFDQQGQQVLATQTSGPLLLLDLPAGSYRVEAELDNEKQGAWVTVEDSADTTPLILSWSQ